MVGLSFPCCTIQDGLLEKLAAEIAGDRLVWAPRQSEDGVCRLQVINSGLPDHAAVARLPFKKLLFPHREKVWSYHNGQYNDVDMPQRIALVGLPLCDLQALWYLDQVFVEDAHYRQRRSRLFVAGAVCEPGPECRCDAALMPVLDFDEHIGNQALIIAQLLERVQPGVPVLIGKVDTNFQYGINSIELLAVSNLCQEQTTQKEENNWSKHWVVRSRTVSGSSRSARAVKPEIFSPSSPSSSPSVLP